MKKRIIAIIISFIAIPIFVLTLIDYSFSATSYKAFYDNIAAENNLLMIYDSADLSNTILEKRNGSLIIEKVYGVVTDEAGNGLVLHTENDFEMALSDDYDSIQSHSFYISYNSVKGVQPGNIILSYFIYNPDSNYIDDIIFRCDYIIDGRICESNNNLLTDT